MSDTREWLERLYGRSPGYFVVTAFADGKVRANRWYSTSDLDDAAKALRATSKRADVYVSMATYASLPEDPRSRGRQKDVLSLPGFWGDLDIGETGHRPSADGLPNPPDESAALSIVEGLPPASMIQHTGGGVQAFWLFEKPWVFQDETDRYEARQASHGWQQLLAQRGAAAGYHVDTLPDLTRILRVPGTANHKTGTPRPVIARKLDGPAHGSGLLASLGEPAREAAEHRPGEVTSDDFPLSWSEILEPHGWTRCHEQDGVGHWARPGKRCGEGHSATTDVYGIPVMVNHSASADLPSGEGKRLTKLRVYAHLNHGGDLKAAMRDLQTRVKTGPEDWAAVAKQFAESRVDWPKLWTEVDPEPDWLIEPFLTRGSQAVFYSEPKVGKSLNSQELASKLTQGQAVMGNPAREPITVVYIDMENTPQDIRRNVGDFGFEGQPMDRLHYYMFPSLSFLDTPEGGRQLHALAMFHGADLVIIDTTSRVVEGAENDADTFNALYKHTGVLLKSAGIAMLRLDHSGKDMARGMRGSSGKATDVDYVWEWKKQDKDMEGCGTVLIGTRTHSRSPYGDREVILERKCKPLLRHERLKTMDDVEHELDGIDMSNVDTGWHGSELDE